jgi:predicted AlkP superfamily pyrophosphatase or phosphodiesterase
MSKLLLWLIFAILIACGNTSDLPTDQKLIVVMLDGCRWDYFTRNPGLSGFQKIKEGGVVADYVQPILPSSSFESWTTISTGKIFFDFFSRKAVFLDCGQPHNPVFIVVNCLFL